MRSTSSANSTNYAISLWVAGMALAWRARAALLKGASLGLLGVWVIGTAGWHAWAGTLPQAEVMGAVGLLALLANAGVALMLYRYRGGDANMRSVWICSRNDAIGNLAVLLAAAGVFGTGTGWPDVIVAAIMAGWASPAAGRSCGRPAASCAGRPPSRHRPDHRDRGARSCPVARFALVIALLAVAAGA